MIEVSKNGQQAENLFKTRQNEICAALNDVDGSNFIEDIWSRDSGGGGITRIIESDLYEKAGVNTSQVFGYLGKTEIPMFNQLVSRVQPSAFVNEKSFFYATGVSLVIHPRNPFIPTVHANYRYFEITLADQQMLWWFGGGADLTPYYLNNDDAIHFHSTLKNVCESYQKGSYDSFKQACDAYFYLPHRQETRGIGGIFFDYLNDDFDELHSFVSNTSMAFIDAYLPILKKRKDTLYNEDQRHWQCIRRGRYAEFNLLHDRGTLFGLKTNGRIESILMSMPPEARWGYNYHPLDGSSEAELLTLLKHPKDWV